MPPFVATLMESPDKLVVIDGKAAVDAAIPSAMRALLSTAPEGMVVVALLAREKMVGAFGCVTPGSPATLPQRYLDVVPRTLAEQIAVVLDNLMLVTRSQERMALWEWLSGVEARLSQADTEEEILSAVVEALRDKEAVHGVLIYADLSEQGRQPEFGRVMAVWQEGGIRPLADDLPQRVPFRRLPMVQDMAEDVVFITDLKAKAAEEAVWRWGVDELGLVSLVGMPLRTKRRWHGVILLGWTEPQVFSDDERFVMRRLMRSAAAIVARRRTYLAAEAARRENAHRAALLEQLTQLQAALSHAKDEVEIAAVIADSLGGEAAQVLVTICYVEASVQGVPEGVYVAAVWPPEATEGQEDEPLMGRRVEIDKTPLASLLEGEQEMHAFLTVTDVLEEEGLPPASLRAMRRRGIRALVIVPLHYGTELLGALLIGWRDRRGLTEDARFILRRIQDPLGAVLAVQQAVREQQRIARESEQRFWQLQTASEVARYASSILNLDELLPRAVELIKERFNLYYVGIFLLDDSGRWAVLRAGTGEAGRIMLERGHKFEVGGQSMIGQCIALREPLLPRVVEEAEVRYVNPLLPDTRSEIAFPLISGGNVLGAMTIQSTEPNYFDEQDILVLGTLSDQLANAIANARFFREAQARMEELQRLQRRYAIETWQGYMAQQDVWGYVYDLKQITPIEREALAFASESWLRAFEDEERAIRAEAGDEARLQAALRLYGEPVGVMSFESPEGNREWSEDELSILESVRGQIELALENRLLFDQSRRALAETRQREAEVRFLQEVAAFLNETEDVVAAQAELLERLRSFIPVQVLAMFAYDAERDEVLWLEAEARGEMGWKGRPVPSDSSAVWAVRHNEIVINDDLREEEHLPGDEILLEEGIIARLIIPLRLGMRTLGALGLGAEEVGVFSRSGVLTVMQQVAAQVASAMERANLFRQTRAALGESQALYRASSALAQAISYEAVLRAMMENAMLSQPAAADIGLFITNPETGEKDVVQIVAALSENPSLPAEEVGRRVAVADIPALVQLEVGGQVICEDVRTDPRAASYRAFYLEQGVHAFILASLVASGEPVGVLHIRFAAPYAPTALERRLYGVMADQAAVVLRNRQLLQESEQRAEQLSAAVRLANLTTAILEREELLRISVDFFKEQFDLYYVGIFLLDEVGQWAELRAGTGEAGEQLLHMGFRLEVGGTSLVGQCVEQRETRVLMDVTKEAGYFRNPLLPDTRSEVALPLISRGQVIGAMSIQSDRRYAFTGDVISTLELMANQLANVIESLNLYERSQNTLAETTALYRIVQRVSDARTASEVLRVAVEGIAQREEPDMVVAGLLIPPENPRSLVVMHTWDRSGQAFPVTEFPLEKIPRLYEALHLQHRFTTADATQDPMVDEYVREIYRQLGVRAMAAFQLEVRGLQYGTIMIHSRKAREFSTAESRFYENVARQAFVALESLNLVETTREEAERRAILNEVLQTASRALEPVALLRDVGVVIARRLEVPVMMWHWDGETPRVVVLCDVEGYPVLSAETLEEAPISRLASVETAIRSRQPVHAQQLSRRESLVLSLLWRGAPTPIELFAVPLIARGETVMGVLVVGRLEEQPPIDEVQREFIQNAAVNIGVALETARLYQEAQETAEKLKEVDQLKNEFLANMSHELRTPLNSIIGFSRVILKGIDGPLTEMQKTDLNAIYQSGQHLLNLINDILDIAKIEAGKMEFTFEPTDLKEIFRGVMSTAVALVKDKPVELIIDVPDDLPTVMADSRRIRQVVLNLVSNAAKFTDQGFIKIGATYDDYQVIVSVQDTGIGIPPDKIDAVFEQFKQVDSSSTRRYGGTGLGVPLSKKFVEQHGGDMWLTSEVGKGTTFYFSLPINGPQAVGEEGAEEEGQAPARVVRTVLAVDDDAQVITLFRRYLEKHGYRIFGLTDPARVVTEAKRLRPYAITLDIIMPGKDGWAVIRELKSDPETRDIPIVVCSVVSEAGKGLSLGVADYIVKPFTEQDLLDALGRLDGDVRDGTILVVDDNADDRHLLRRILEDAGYRVAEAAGGEEAIAQIQSYYPSLVVLDLMMPGMDGFAVLEHLKEDETTRNIPVVVVTAKELSEAEREYLQQRVEYLLEKGLFDQNQLLRNIAEALNRLAR